VALQRDSADAWDRIPPLQPQQTSQTHHYLLQLIISEIQSELLRHANSWHLLMICLAWQSPGLWEAAAQRDGVGPQGLRVRVVGGEMAG